jgi:uncharacterized protein YrrD
MITRTTIDTSTRLAFGSPVVCADGLFGELIEIVIDPSTRRVVHVVVEPHHRHWPARLVAFDVISAASDERRLLLTCTVAQARRFAQTQCTALLPIGGELCIDPAWEVGVEGVFMQPARGPVAWTHDAVMAATYDRVPKGEVEIRRASKVMSADGHPLGHVHACIVDDEQRITDIVLERGHPWARRDVTIPICDVAAVQSDAITLQVVEDQVGVQHPSPVLHGH